MEQLSTEQWLLLVVIVGTPVVAVFYWLHTIANDDIEV